MNKSHYIFNTSLPDEQVVMFQWPSGSRGSHRCALKETELGLVTFAQVPVSAHHYQIRKTFV